MKKEKRERGASTTSQSHSHSVSAAAAMTSIKFKNVLTKLFAWMIPKSFRKQDSLPECVLLLGEGHPDPDCDSGDEEI